MHCPQCHTQQFTLAAACPDCGFTGDLHLLERLSNLNFVLTESETWGLVRSLLQPIQSRYQKQQREVEISLGLRQPPPTAAEARILRLELAKFTYLQHTIPRWQQKKWLSAPRYAGCGKPPGMANSLSTFDSPKVAKANSPSRLGTVADSSDALFFVSGGDILNDHLVTF